MDADCFVPLLRPFVVRRARPLLRVVDCLTIVWAAQIIDSKLVSRILSISFGRIVRCDMPPPKPGAKPFAFVEFEDSRDADDAFKDMHGRQLNGYRLSIQWAKQPPRPIDGGSGPRDREAPRDAPREPPRDYRDQRDMRDMREPPRDYRDRRPSRDRDPYDRRAPERRVGTRRCAPRRTGRTQSIDIYSNGVPHDEAVPGSSDEPFSNAIDVPRECSKPSKLPLSIAHYESDRYVVRLARYAHTVPTHRTTLTFPASQRSRSPLAPPPQQQRRRTPSPPRRRTPSPQALRGRSPTPRDRR